MDSVIGPRPESCGDDGSEKHARITELMHEGSPCRLTKPGVLTVPISLYHNREILITPHPRRGWRADFPRLYLLYREGRSA